MTEPRRPGTIPERLLDGLAALLLRVAGAGLVLLIAIFGWLVWGRYVRNDTPTWVEQVSLLLVVTISFLGAAAGVRTGSHLSVTLFRDAAGPRFRLLLDLFNDLALALFGGAMAWFAWRLAMRNWTTEIPLLGLPEGLRALPAAACGALVVLFCAARLARRIADAATGRAGG